MAARSTSSSVAPSSLTISSLAAAGGARRSDKEADGGSQVPKSSVSSSVGATTTVLQKRLDVIQEELKFERTKREAAQQQLLQTAKELEALEKLLAVRK